MLKFHYLALASVLAFSMAACVTSTDSQSQVALAAPGTVPLPDFIRVNFAPPNPTVPALLSSFLGKWGGKWGGQLASNLYVESVEADGTARGVYSWDNAPQYNVTRSASRFIGKIKDGMLAWGDSTKFEFTLLPDGKLQGARFVNGNNSGNGIMTRMPSP